MITRVSGDGTWQDSRALDPHGSKGAQLEAEHERVVQPRSTLTNVVNGQAAMP